MTRTYVMHAPVMRRFAIVALAALLALAAFLPASLVGPVRAGDRPTIVLLHGAWASPPGWAMTIDRLEQAGYETVAPQLSLLGLAEDVAIARAALDAIAGDKVLVAHSYGGFVANVAHGRTDVLAIVYTAAFVPDEGDSILSLGVGFPESAVLHHLEWLGDPFASLSYIIRDDFHDVFASDLNPKLAQQLNDGQLPTSPAILVTPSGPGAWHEVPTWYAISGKDAVIPSSLQRWMAERAGSTIIEFPAASHAGGYTHYVARLVDLIDAAAKAEAR
jgi:pimeloyl-ACP methyl ester carboxylesterase